MNAVILILEIIAFIGFLTAAILAFLRYNKTRYATNLWLLFASSFLIFSIVAILRIIEEFPDFQIFGHLESMLLLVGATLLFSAQAIYQKDKTFCKECYERNVKKFDGKTRKELEGWLKTI